MRARVRLDGVLLDSVADTSGVKHSTVFRRDNWSGDYQASCEFGAPPDFEAAWFAEGKRFEVVKGGCVLWSGILTEKTPGEAWSLHAFGYGSDAENFMALADQGAGLQVSSDPTDVIDRAISAGWAVRKVGAFGTDPISTDNSETRTVAELLSTAAQNDGKRWGVDSNRDLSLLVEPTSPKWVVSPGDAYLGTVDDEYVTHLHGFYVASVNTDGTPDTFATATAVDANAVAKFGAVRERTVDLTGMGLLASSIAQIIVNKRLAMIGGRTGWTNAVTLHDLNVRHIGGSWAEPNMVKAGDMLRIPGVMDSRSNPTTRGSIDIVLGEVEHDEDAGVSVATPLGFVPRDFAGALAAAQPPPERVEAA